MSMNTFLLDWVFIAFFIGLAYVLGARKFFLLLIMIVMGSWAFFLIAYYAFGIYIG